MPVMPVGGADKSCQVRLLHLTTEITDYEKEDTMLRIKIFRISALYIFLFFSVFCHPVSADELILENGDRISGTIISMDKGILTLSTSYSEPVKIQRTKIKRITMKNDAVLQLLNGEVLKGKLDTEENGSMYIQSTDARGKTMVDWSKVSAINPPPAVGPKWKGNITLGGNAQTGNTSRSSLSLGADATRRTLDDRISFRFLYNYAKENHVMSTRNIYGALKYDYFFTKAFYGYVGIELLNDKFKDLSLRAIVGPGVGYQIWEDPVKFLSVEAGLTYVSDNYKIAEDKDYLSARLAGNFSYKLWDRVVFGDQFILYPNLDHLGRYKLRNEASITSALGSGWALKFANILERDSNPPLGIRKNDINWILGLQYSF